MARASARQCAPDIVFDCQLQFAALDLHTLDVLNLNAGEKVKRRYEWAMQAHVTQELQAGVQLCRGAPADR